MIRDVGFQVAGFLNYILYVFTSISENAVDVTTGGG